MMLKKPRQQVLQITSALHPHVLPLVVDTLMYAASIKCSEDEVELSKWNLSTDAYSFLYNPDLWQQGGKV